MNNKKNMMEEETLDPEDWRRMRDLGHRMLDDIMDYMGKLREYPVWVPAPESVKANFQGPPPPGTRVSGGYLFRIS